MSTFAELAALPGVGVNYLLEVSQDRFITVPYAYAITSTSFGGRDYDGRITDIGRLQRGFGVDGLYASSTVSLRLSNVDGAVDWMTSPATVASGLLRSRFRLSMQLFDPADPTDAQSKVLGVFVCLDYPKRDDSVVTLSLADDALGDAAELAIAPSYGDWATAAAVVEPVDWNVEYTRPIQLLFGATQGAPLPVVSPFTWNGGNVNTGFIVLYATTQNDPVTTPPYFWASRLVSSKGIQIEPTARNSLTILFEMKTTGPLSSDGKNWYVHWLRLYPQNFWLDQTLSLELVQLGLANGASDAEIMAALGSFSVDCWPGSSRSFTAPNLTVDYSGFGFGVHGSDVIFDLLVHYSKVPVADVVTATFDAVKAAWPGSRVRGVIADGGEVAETGGAFSVVRSDGRLRGVLRQICRTSSIDLFAGWDGKLRVAGATATYSSIVAGSAGTLPTFEETRCLEGSVTLRTPSTGERWAPYNRLYIKRPDGRLFGPYDNQQAITAFGRVIAKTIQVDWADFMVQSLGLTFSTGNTGWAALTGHIPIESKVRPVITFQYPIEAVSLVDLADYFVMSVTRGASGFTDSYTNAIWKVEAITLLPLTGYAEVTAVWSSDITTELAYLLDDENEQLVTSQATHGGNPSVTNGSQTVTFSGGNLNTAGGGVFAGDILVLQDGTEGATGFLRSRGLLIEDVNSATTLKVSGSESTAFGGVGLSVATWKILRGKTLLGTTGSYPDGSYMYGANVVNGVYSDSVGGNQFKAG